MNVLIKFEETKKHTNIMGLTVTVKLTVKDPSYTPGGTGQSTMQIIHSLDHDPFNYPHRTYKVTFAGTSGQETLTFEVRNFSKPEPNLITGNSTVVYELSAFGVEQEDGTVYGNE